MNTTTQDMMFSPSVQVNFMTAYQGFGEWCVSPPRFAIRRGAEMLVYLY